MEALVFLEHVENFLNNAEFIGWNIHFAKSFGGVAESGGEWSVWNIVHVASSESLVGKGDADKSRELIIAKSILLLVFASLLEQLLWSEVAVSGEDESGEFLGLSLDTAHLLLVLAKKLADEAWVIWVLGS
jgi:hypothetical protein